MQKTYQNINSTNTQKRLKECKNNRKITRSDTQLENTSTVLKTLMRQQQ